MATAPDLVPIAGRGYYAPGYYNPADVPLSTFDQMLQRDPVVKFASRFVARSTRRRLGDFQHEDERVREYVERCVMPAALRDLHRIQTAVYYGASIAQPRYVANGSELVLAELVGCQPYRWWYGGGFTRDDEGAVVSVDIAGTGLVPFFTDSGVRQVIHYAADDDYGSPYGNPAARQAYTAWYIKHRLQAFEAIGLEKHGLGTAVFSVADNTPDQTGLAPGQAYVDAWSAMGSASAMAKDKDDDLTVVQPGWGSASPFDAVIRRLDGYVFNSFYLPHLLMGESNFGTRAQASVALEAYLMAETDMAEDLADRVVVEQIIKPAVELQFGAGTDPGTVAIRDASPPDREQWANIIRNLAAVGMFDAGVEEQARWAGELLELPTADLSAYLATGAGQPLA